MARLHSILRLAPKFSVGSEVAFVKAVARAVDKPLSPSLPQFIPQQTTPVQWSGGGTTFHHAQTGNTPVGLGVYSPEYLEMMNLDLSVNQDDPYLIPDSYAPEGGEDPLQDVHTVEPVDNIETDEDTAQDIVDDVAEGKSIAQVAEEYGISPQDVLDQLEADGLEVEATQSDDGSESSVEIVDGETDETVVEYRFTEQPDGVVVEESTNADGETTTTVIDEQGNRTELDPEQETTREGVDEIVEGVADGQSIDEIADEQGLTRAQVIAQLEAAGFEIESGVEGQGPSYSNTTRITDEESGELIVSHEAGPGGTSTSVVIDADGNETRRTEHADGSTTEVVTEPNGRETTTTVDADGKTTTTVRYEQNGVMVEDVTDDDGKTTTTIIDEDGNRTELEPEQETTREGIDEIAEAVADGKSIDEIADDQGLTREQVIAQLRAAGYVVESETDELANGGEQYTTKIVDAEDGEEVIASYSTGRGIENSSLFIDAEGNETRRTEHNDGSTTETVTEEGGRETETVVEADGSTTETVTETDGREIKTTTNGDGETTREVTDNSYTLITPPDGDLTLRNSEDGKEREIARGSVDQSLAEELLELDPSDSDEDEALQEFIEEMLMERDEEGNVTEFDDLETALDAQEEATQEAIEEIIGEDGNKSDVIKPGESSEESDPLGPPPDEETSNGEDWVAMRHEGNWAWVDPAVAEALEEEEAARTALEQARGEVWRRQEQIEVYTHSDEIMGNVGDRLDELLAPHGLRWVAPEPKGTAEEAQEGLDNANAWIDYLEAKEEYREVAEEYQALQEEADDLKERALEVYGDDEGYEKYFQEEGFEEVIESGTPANPLGEKEETGELLHQSVVERDGQLYLKNVYADRDEPIYKKLTQDPASDPSGLSDAQRRLNQDWHELKMGDEPAQLQSDALEAFREANPDYFDPDGYSETLSQGPGPTREWESGELTDTRVVERDGQLYVINTYGEGFSKTTKEFPITYAPGEESEELTQAQQDASQAWQEFTRDKDINEDLETRILEDARERHPDYFEDEGFTETTSSPAGTEENPTGALLDQQVIERDGQLFLVNTYENLDEPLEIQLTFDPDGSGSTARTETQQQFDKDWESWKEHRYSGEGSLVQAAQERAEAQRTLTEISNEQNAGYIEELEGAIPELERALDDAIEEHGEGSVGEDAEQIEIDGETRWVHPEVAAAHHDLVAARNALGEGEDILERAKELYGEQHPDHLDPEGFHESKTYGNNTTYVSTGDLMGEGDDFFVGEDGQLYLRNRYEDRDDPYEFPLTYAPGEAPEGRTEAQREIDRHWADWWEEHGHDGDSEAPLAEATQRVSGAEEARSGAIEAYGGGTTRELTGPLPDDVEPVLVMIDGEQRWVHPDVATALGALSMVEDQIASVRVAMEEAELALEEADYRSARPSTWKLLDDAASLEHEQGVMVEWQMEDAYLDAHGTEGTLTRAWQDRVESREVLLTTQIGLTEAGLPMASVDGEGPDHDVAELREMLEENGALGEQLAESSQWNDFLGDESLDDRLDSDQWQAQQERYFEQNPEVADKAIDDRLADLPSSVSMENEGAARQKLGEALGTDESAVVDPVLDQLRELGGSDADVEIIPILYRDSSEGVRDTALFRVRDEDGRSWLIDESGSKYRNFEDYRQHNYLSDEGHVFLPESPNRLTDASGDLTYEWHQARELSFAEQWLDPIVGIGTGIATVASFIPPLAPIAAPIAFAGGAYFGARSATNLHEMHEHGRPLASTEGLVQGAMLATSVLPMGAGAFRFAGLTQAGISRGVALRTSIGNVNIRGHLWSDNPMYQHAAQLMTQRGTAFDIARRLDVASMMTGAPLLAYSGHNILMNWGEMSQLQRTDAMIGFVSGLFGVGMGYRALNAGRPRQDSADTAPMFRFTDAAGNPVDARMLGRLPEDISNIYMQPDIGPRPRGDEAGVMNKTHIFHRDPKSGEAYVMPWIRGASEVPSTQQTTTPPQGLARLYRLSDLETLNQASQDGTLPPDHYVHFVRSINAGLDNGTFMIHGGTVPSSGRIDQNGHIRWPSSQKGQPVTLSVADEGNGQQTVLIHDTTGSELPREVRSNGDVFAIVSNARVSDVRAQVKGGGLPFTVYSGNGLWSMASNLSANNPQSPTPAEKPSQITQPPETIQKNTSEKQVPPATVENQQAQSQGSSEAPQRKNRSEKVIGSILGAAGAAGVSLSTHPLADAIAFAARGASLTVRSLLPNHTKVDQFWGRVLRGLEFWTLSVNLPGSASAVMQGSNVDINLPYAAGHLAYIIKNYVEATTGKPFAPYTDDVALPLYLAGSVPYTTSSLRGGDHGAFVDATGAAGGGLFVVGSALLWVQSSATWQKGVKPIITKLWPVTASSTKLPQENSTLPRVNGQSEESSQKSESKLKPTFTTPLTYGIGLGFFAASSAAVAWSNSRNEKEDDPDVDEAPTVEPPSDDENGREVDEAPTVEPPSDDENGREVDEAPTVEPPSDDGNGQGDEEPVLEPFGSNGRGRFNLELEHLGHDWVEVQPSQSLGSIALAHGYDVASVAMLNLDHIVDPTSLKAGDRIYLPRATQVSPSHNERVTA